MKTKFENGEWYYYCTENQDWKVFTQQMLIAITSNNYD